MARRALSVRSARRAPRLVRRLAALLAAVTVGATGTVAVPAAAAEFRSVGASAAVLYDAPSARARKLFVAPYGMPVEVLSVVEPFAKVRDAAGDVLWMERAALAERRTVVATRRAVVRAAASDTAPVVFAAAPGVILELVAVPDPDWARVRHAEGEGFVRIGEVWGL